MNGRFSMEIDSKSRIEEIDMLRGVAIIITVIAHSKLLFLWSPPWLLWIHENFLFGNGVDLFFVISGFVVTRSLLDRFLDWPTFFLEYRFFIIRRFWRLAPAALFFFIFYLIY
jgi:peptidoglycan/LPS O-acetylase OafA/YrhL